MGRKQAVLSVVFLLGLAGLCRAEGESLLLRETLTDGKRSIGRFLDKNYRDDVGVYTSCDQVFHKKNADTEDDQGLGGFFRYGYAPSKKDDIANFYSLGLQYQGLFDGWDDDILDAAFAYGSFSNTVTSGIRKITRTPWKSITTLESQLCSI